VVRMASFFDLLVGTLVSEFESRDIGHFITPMAYTLKNVIIRSGSTLAVFLLQ
jgi:hypothetical protein